MGKSWLLLLAGCLLILGGGWLAASIQTAGGVKVRDVRFAGDGGVVMSGLLYTPPGATARRPAPGVLAVHGYINSRETQSGFAIEFARRGYVVLAIDQTGHGYSGGAAFSNGFGGPAGLRYLRSLDYVDNANIGLEGHSMGGWTVLAAAAAMPDAYKAVVLEGSSTGMPFAAEGSPVWPRNLGLVFSRYDEFSKIMWGVDRAQDVTASAKLQSVFGVKAPITAGRIYGDIDHDTARRLTTPVTTHPGDHISPEAIGDATDWFARTLKGGAPRPAGDQIWMWKELGTGIALIGLVVLMLGAFAVLTDLPPFASMRHPPLALTAYRDTRWQVGLAITALVPVLTYFPAFILVTLAVKPTALFGQAITNQVAVWALINAAITLHMAVFGGLRPRFDYRWGLAALAALITVAVGYGAAMLADRLFLIDFRFWVVALKVFSPDQAKIALIYLPAFLVFFLITLRSLHARFAVKGEGVVSQYMTAVVALAGGFLMLLGIDYGLFFATGALPTAFDPLSTVVAIQFMPLLSIIAIIAVFTWRRTNSYVPGAFICALFTTWYVVAGTATQVTLGTP